MIKSCLVIGQFSMFYMRESMAFSVPCTMRFSDRSLSLSTAPDWINKLGQICTMYYWIYVPVTITIQPLTIILLI